jgi:hypothetical protein
LLDEVEKGFDAVKKGLFWSIMDKVSCCTPLVSVRQGYEEGKGWWRSVDGECAVGSGAVTAGG